VAASQGVRWSADGKKLYLSAGQNISRDIQNWALLVTDLAGKVTVLMSGPGWRTPPVPSPDGRLLLYAAGTERSSIVMLENF
jgi:Tol biopolymer transport system component